MIGSTTTMTTAANKTVGSAMSELEAKRQAVLASMMKRRAAARSRSTSESPLVSASATPVHTIERVSLPTLEEAIVDLRSLGYTFDMILEKSGITRDFLEKCYRHWNLPIPIRPVEETTPVAPQRPIHIHHQHQHHSSSSLHIHKKPLFSNKVYRPDGGRPEWLGGLIIDLESSDDDSEESQESEDEHLEESEIMETTVAAIEVSEVNEELTVEEGQDSCLPEMVDMKAITRQRSSSNTSTSSIFGQPDIFDEENDDYDPEDLPRKKRKLSNELRFGHLTMDELQSKKTALKEKMHDTSGQVSTIDNRRLEIETSIQLSMNTIKEKELRVTTYRNMIHSLESEIQQENDIISSLTHEKISLPDARAEMAKYLIEMETLEIEEKKLKETERKRVELRSKLLKQMNEKKKKKEQQMQQQTVTTQLPPQDLHKQDVEQQQSSPTSPQLTTQQETHMNVESIETNDMIPEKQVYDETIHKIPKAQPSHFTPYKSLGLTRKAHATTDDADMALCPLELVNGSCTDKQCRFKHL